MNTKVKYLILLIIGTTVGIIGYFILQKYTLNQPSTLTIEEHEEYSSFQSRSDDKRYMTQTQIDECNDKGGTVNVGGMSQSQYCSITYQDGGKECTDGSQCISKRCEADLIKYGKQPKNSDGEYIGSCARSNNSHGCRPQNIENGQLTGFQLCSD